MEKARDQTVQYIRAKEMIVEYIKKHGFTTKSIIRIKSDNIIEIVPRVEYNNKSCGGYAMDYLPSMGLRNKREALAR